MIRSCRLAIQSTVYNGEHKNKMRGFRGSYDSNSLAVSKITGWDLLGSARSQGDQTIHRSGIPDEQPDLRTVRSAVLHRDFFANTKKPTTQMEAKCHVHFHAYDRICSKYPVLVLIQVDGLLAGVLWVVSAFGDWDICTTEYPFEQIHWMLRFH